MLSLRFCSMISYYLFTVLNSKKYCFARGSNQILIFNCGGSYSASVKTRTSKPLTVCHSIMICTSVLFSTAVCLAFSYPLLKFPSPPSKRRKRKPVAKPRALRAGSSLTQSVRNTSYYARTGFDFVQPSEIQVFVKCVLFSTVAFALSLVCYFLFVPILMSIS